MKSEELPKERTNGERPASDMTKREVIATEAMLGYIASSEYASDPETVAATAIKYADELLKQLEHGSK